MTNEELVAAIQAGAADGKERLLEQNKRILHKVAGRYLYRARINRALDMEDLVQAAALGMLEAIPQWEEQRGSFLTVAMLYMTRSIREALGIHTSKQRVENMGTASLDMCVDEDTPLVDLLPDDRAVSPEESAIAANEREIIQRALDALPQEQGQAVRAWMNRELCASHSGEIQRAFQTLRKNWRLKKLVFDYDAAPYRHQSFSAWKDTHTSATEAAAIRREELLQYLLHSANRPSGFFSPHSHR